MKTKGQKTIEAMGTGTGAGWLQVMICAAFAALLLDACRSALFDGCNLYTRQAAGVFAARQWSSNRGKWSPVAIRRGARGGFDLAQPLVAEAEEPISARRGGWLAGHEAARAARLLASVDDCKAFARLRQVARDLKDKAKPVQPCNGTLDAVARRSRRVARFAPFSGLAIQYFSNPLPVYRLGASLSQNGAVSAPVESDNLRPLFDLCAFGEAARIAEVRGRKWTRGTHSSAKGAREKAEIGAAAGADDVADYHIRLEVEAVAIFRHAALVHVSRVLSRATRFGVLLNWSDMRRVTASKRASRAGRKAAEAWEYAAVKGRDGREVAGGWALQGAVHGLRDFRLETPAPLDSGAGAETDDMGASEWSAMLDASAARLGLDLGAGAEVAEVVVVSDDMQAAIAEASEVRELGGLSWAPDSGAGSGRRPSVMGALQGMVDGVRESVAVRVKRSASNQAAIQAQAAGNRQIDLVQALREWVTDGKPLPAELVAEFWPNGDTSAPLSSSARSKIKRLRDRAGFEVLSGPARAKEPRKPSQILL